MAARVDSSVLLRTLDKADHPLGLAELLRACGLHGGQRTEVKRTMRALVREGRVERTGQRFWLAGRRPPSKDGHRPAAGPRARKVLEGTLTVHRDGFGFVVPKIERRRILACSFSSRKFPGRAPDGCVLLRVFLGGAQQPEMVELPEEELRTIVLEELGELLGATGEPQLFQVVRWRQAMPQYHLGHLERVARIEQAVAALPGLELAGNAYRGVGIPDCIKSGEQAAERRVAMQWATRANEAYTTLRSPQKRAAYLVERAGVPIDAESNTAMPPAFLMQQMEWREALDEARDDPATLDALRETMSEQRSELIGAIGHAIDESRDYAQAAALVRQLMFIDRFASEVGQAAEAVDADADAARRRASA